MNRAVYDEFCRVLGYFRAEVVQEQAQRGLGHPRLVGQIGSSRARAVIASSVVTVIPQLCRVACVGLA